MSFTPETQVAEVATQHPATIRVFQRHGIDFCCGGKRPLAQACAEAGISFDTLRDDLSTALAAPAPAQRSWSEASLTDLTDHIVARYHSWLYEEMPRLLAMSEKVARVHGERHAEVRELFQVMQALNADLMPHMMKEERVLFPYLRHMDALRAAGQPLAASPFGTVQSPIRMMEMEHEAVGELIARARQLTAGFTAPADACNTYMGLYHGLAELERELHEHIHLENNVQFPRATAMEAQLQSVPV